MPFSFRNFYHPAPAQVQRWAAACKGIGTLISSASLAADKPWLLWAGLTLCAVGEGLEKLWPQATLPDPAAEPAPEDAATACEQANTPQS
jgi:hypothetical protein